MKYITFFIIVIILSSCKNLVQVIETKTTNTEIFNDEYVFENDSIKITYNFWRENGSLKFAVYNKKDKPLYINWKKSSYINNSIKRNYWEDEENSLTDSYKVYDFNESAGRKRTKSIKPEKITFIPPKSNFIKNQFLILPININFHNSDTKKIKSLIRSNKEIEIKQEHYQKSNTPLIFRNFLTLSYSENFDQEFYIDNEFYISKAFEIDAKDFSAYERDPEKPNFYKKDETGNRILLNPYKSGTSFYNLIKQ